MPNSPATYASEKISNVGAGQLPISEAGSGHWRARGQPSEHRAVACPPQQSCRESSVTYTDFSRTSSPAWGKELGSPKAGVLQIYMFI